MRQDFPREGLVWPHRLNAAIVIAVVSLMVAFALIAALRGSIVAAVAALLLLWVWRILVLAYATAYGNLAATEAGIVVTCFGIDVRHIPWSSLTDIFRVPYGLGRAYRRVPGYHYRLFFTATRRSSLSFRSIMTVDATVRNGNELVRMAAERAGITIIDRVY